jgi:hypothetical protein
MITLDEMQKLCDEATCGPWEANKQYVRIQVKDDPYSLICWSDDGGFLRGEDVFFIAASREFVPWAIKRIQKLEKVAEVARYTTCNHMGDAVEYYSVPKYEIENMQEVLKELEK